MTKDQKSHFNMEYQKYNKQKVSKITPANETKLRGG